MIVVVAVVNHVAKERVLAPGTMDFSGPQKSLQELQHKLSFHDDVELTVLAEATSVRYQFRG